MKFPKYIISILTIILILGGAIFIWKNRENTSSSSQVEESVPSTSNQDTSKSTTSQESLLISTEDIVTEE